MYIITLIVQIRHKSLVLILVAIINFILSFYFVIAYTFTLESYFLLLQIISINNK